MAKKIAKIEVINPGSPPDVDSDFHTVHREDAIRHVTETYGKDNVANIVTFGTYAAKAAFKQMCTIYGVNFARANKIAALYPGLVQGKQPSLKDIYNPDHPRYAEGEDFRNAVAEPEWEKVIKGALAIEGRNKSWGVHACFTPETLIKTIVGYKAIVDVTENDYVLTHTNTYKKVVEKIVTQDQELYHLVASNSIPVDVTGNHPVYVKEINRNEKKRSLSTTPVWKNVDELVPGNDVIGTLVNTKSELPENIEDFDLPFDNADFWWIAGRFLGDGWCEDFDSTRNRTRKDGTAYKYVHHEKNLVISVGKNDNTLGELENKISRLFSYRIDKRENATAWKFYITGNNDVFEYFKKFGKYAENKQVPDEVLNLPVELLEHFIAGYLSADGYLVSSTNTQTFSSVSKKLVLGMISAINKVYKTHCLVRVEKRDKMLIGDREVQCKDRYTASFNKEVNDKKQSFYEDGYIWAKVSSISKIESVEKTYNLSVIDDNSYVANGLIVHNCGIVMSAKPLSDVIPIHVRPKDQRVITQWTYPECESLGLIKMDFLGLDTVDLVQNTVTNIIKMGKEAPDMIELIHGPMDDPEVYKLFQEGNTIGIFQFGSDMVRQLLLHTKPTEFADLPAITSVARPGPMGMQSHTKYADRKNNREEIDYIHPDFSGTEMEEILGKTQGLIVYQEQVQQISNKIAGMTLQEGDDLRRAMGKKKKKVMDSMRPKFFNGASKNGFSEEAINVLWDTLAPFSEYGFNKCLHSKSLIALPNGQGKTTIEELYKRQQNGEKNIQILSMFENGEIKPHTVKNIVQSGVKPLYKVKTQSGKILRLTKEHRLLTPDGYGTIEDGTIRVGNELIVDAEWTKRLSDKTRKTRQETMSAVNKTSEQREKAKNRMIAYQKTLSFLDRSEHQKNIQKNNPERSAKSLLAMQERLSYLRSSDVDWQKKVLESNKIAREQYAGIRKGYGVPTVLSDGRTADSLAEAAAAEYLLSRGIEFEMHKVFTSVHGTAKITDFYVDGLYFEMDGLRRGREYFVKEKYGTEIPFVYLTPQNFGDEIDNALLSHHIENGDEIVEVLEPKILPNGSILREMTYDIEMDTTGPANFIANGIVSHNSHAVAYAMNSYQSAYLKVHFPVEFMASLISQHVDNKDKVLMYLRDANRMGLKVGTTDINLSEIHVAPNFHKKSDEDMDIIFGLAGIKAVSNEMAEIIVTERNENGPYTSVKDVVSRCYPLGVDKRTVYENLALSGAFDGFGVSRKTVFENIVNLLDASKTDVKKGEDLFGAFDVADDSLEIDLTGEDYPFLERLKKEASMAGLYLSAHPTDKINDSLLKGSAQSIKKLRSLNISRPMKTTVVGSILGMDVKRNKRGAKTISVELDDGTGYMTLYVGKHIVEGIEKYNAQQKIKQVYESGTGEISPEILEKATDPLVQVVKDIEKYDLYTMDITYKVDKSDEESESQNYRAQINSIKPLPLADNGSLPIRIRFKKTDTNRDKMNKLEKMLPASLGKKIPGEFPIYTASYDENELYVDEQILFETAYDIVKLGLQDDNKESRVWPPKITRKSKYKPSQEDLHVSLENLEYTNSGFSTDKTQRVEQAIEKYVGYGAYDFGVFNPESLTED